MVDEIDEPRLDPAQPLSNAEVAHALNSLHGWRREENGIRKRFRRGDFRDAIAFVNAIADLAEKASHHPDIDIRWRNVTLALTTHDAGGLTQNDFDLAAQIDEILG